MNQVFILCLVVVLGSMALMCSAGVLQHDSTKVTQHHEDLPTKKKRETSEKLVQNSDLPVYVSEDGYTIVTVPRTAEKHSLIESLMKMFRNGSKFDNQALLLIAPQTTYRVGGDITNKNEAVPVHDHATLSANNTIIENATLLNTIDDQETAESARIDTATWLSENVLLLGKDSNLNKELLVFMNEDAHRKIDPSELEFLDTTGINYDVKAIDNNIDSDQTVTDTIRHMHTVVDTTPIPNTSPSESEITSDLKDTDTSSNITVSDDNITPPSPKDSGTATTSNLKVSDVENASDQVTDNTTPTTTSEPTNSNTTDISITSTDPTPHDLENTQETHNFDDPIVEHYDAQSSDTVIAQSVVKAPTSASTNLTDDELVAQALEMTCFNDLVNDLSLISNSIDGPIRLEATNKILNEGEPLINVCRDSQRELIDIFHMGLGQLSSLFNAMYKKMASVSSLTIE